ncbi:MAG: tetratricopeptide repeat protein [Synechococcaceae cyanobacterium SM2_3_1]|nr:tetratricopeptide repeat protein [Synechococcaceae cyanobacterium SM2_3_1]
MAASPADNSPSLAASLALIEAHFERGRYRQALEQVEEALETHPQSGSLRLWRAISLEAMGYTPEAIAVVRTLLHYPEWDISQQADYLLYIWQAPRLQRPQAWLSEIPDLSHLSDSDWNFTSGTSVPPTPAKDAAAPEKPATANTKAGEASPSNYRMIKILVGVCVLAAVIGLLTQILH